MFKKKMVNDIEEPTLKKKKKLLTKQNLVKITYFSLILLGVLIVYRFQRAYSIVYTEEIKNVEIEDNGYDSDVKGSWHIDKSADWIGLNRARINFDLNSRVLTSGGYKDIVLVMDVSGSMRGSKIQRAIEDAKEITNALLSDSNNKMALITFATTSSIITGFTNNKEAMLGYLDSLSATGSTNYNSGLLNADEVLEGYVKENNRELVLLFLTDGYPNVDTPNQVATAGLLKTKYPYMTINGVQYEMGRNLIKEIDEITDNAWVADQDTLNNVLFAASMSPTAYDNFKIIDYISNDYYVESVDDIKVSSGTVTLEIENGLQKVTWDLGNTYHTGNKKRMTIDATLKEVNQGRLGFYPTNESEKIISKLPTEEEKELVSDKTPVLKNVYNVVYEGNPPSNCNINYRETESHSIYETVTKKNEELLCDGYIFKGFSNVENDVEFINDDLYIMPGHDILFRGIWSKPAIAKSMDGVVRTSYSATLDTGRIVNSKMKSLANKSNVSYSTQDNLIKQIERSNELPSGFEATSANTISSSTSEIPVYIWFDETAETIYYYTEADKLYLNRDASYLFDAFGKLTTLDLSGLYTSNVTSMDYMFYGCSKLESLNLGNNFDTSKVTNMSNMFYNCSSLTSLDLGSNFNTSSVINMSKMFCGCNRLTNLDLGNKFNTQIVEDMSFIFSECSSLTSLDLSSFNTSKVTDMEQMFYKCESLTILNLSNFNTSKVTDMYQMFYGCSNLTGLNLGSGFDTSSVKNMYRMFMRCSSLTNLDLGNSFDTSNVTNMSAMFTYCSSLISLDLGEKFNTEKVTNMFGMFSQCSSLTSLILGDNFNTSNVTNMSEMFKLCSSLTSLDLGDKFDTTKVTTMKSMFLDCNSLRTIYISESFVRSNNLVSTDMFKNCTSLVGGNGTTYTVGNYDATYARIDGENDLPGFFTYKESTI